MSNLLQNIDARTKLAGTNKLEILLFTLGTDQRSGRRETFGINVFKVREILVMPTITAIAGGKLGDKRIDGYDQSATIHGDAPCLPLIYHAAHPLPASSIPAPHSSHPNWK